jgi:hypothetical protein
MISKLPGWLNFILLYLFYLVLMLLELALLRFLILKLGMLGAFVNAIALFYAGGYLAKWREKQGGGWIFY